uniref:NADP-dependent oxidoreductase domain-containing protein n=1 Tax=Odontella aurita TaxID=265563 RepID=A0A7S4NDG9_9STRA|mmetsp:Transcript_60105/g.178203  ORF Transcript_60105/g.178203 Transcript_60105/m.178203 type:complete len:365 (+) Transcript_60105:30-1124(+)
MRQSLCRRLGFIGLQGLLQISSTTIFFTTEAHSLCTGVSKSHLSIGSLSVAPVILGTLRLAVDDDDALTKATNLLRAAPRGTLIDTAELYGDGKVEALLGEAANRADRKLGPDDLPVATKFAPGPFRLNSGSVVEACRASARRLNVEKIDLYQMHFRDIKQPLSIIGLRNEKDEDYWDGLAECYHAGLISNVGVCNYGPETLRRAHNYLSNRGVPLVSNQINFNLMRYRSSGETKDACDELGVCVMGYHPLGNGALAGKYDLDDLTTLPTLPSKRRRMKWYLKNSRPVVDVVRRIAESRGKSCAHVATNWVLHKGAVPIVGSRDDVQFADSLGSAGWSLSKEEVEQLDEASDASAEYERGFELV